MSTYTTTDKWDNVKTYNIPNHLKGLTKDRVISEIFSMDYHDDGEYINCKSNIMQYEIFNVVIKIKK